MMENILAHTVGMFFTVVLFSVYTLGGKIFTANWIEIAATLTLFGVVYEILSWVLFNLFRYFSNSRREVGEIVTVTPDEPSK